MKDLFVDLSVMSTGMFLHVYLEVTILNLLFNFNLTNKSRIIFSIIAGLCLAIFKLMAPQSISVFNPILFILLITVYFAVFNKITIVKSIISALLILIISIPIELISGIIGFIVLNLPSNNDNVIATIPVLLIISVWYLLIIGFLCIYKKRKDIAMQFSGRFIGINICIVALFIVPNVMFYTANTYNYPIWLLLYNILANIVLVLLAIYNTYKHIKLETTERDLKNSELNNRNLKELNDSIRVFKHDYNNVIHAIGGYIALEDLNGLEQYYNELKSDTTKVNQLENITPESINEPSVYGIIASKFQLAEEKHINFNFVSMINYQKLGMPIYDFCKIVGVLIDNAIEAADETEEKEININVRQSNKTGIQLFSIENTYLNKDIDIEQIYKKDFSTKGRNSGLGLWEVKNIVNKNKNVTLVTNKDDKFFKQDLYIQIK